MKNLYPAISFLFLLCFVSVFQTAAQEPVKTSNGQVSEQVLKEILAEIKQLRSTLTRTSVNQIRFQTAFEQYKSQQSRVDSMNRELDAVKNQISSNPFRSNSEDFIKQAEERLNQTTDPQQRQNLERQIQSYKRSLEVQTQRDKRLKDRQTELELQIPVEQGKLYQLNAEIENIKQDMSRLLSQ